MKAVVQREYGPPAVLRLDEVDLPRASGNEVLVRVCASAVAGDDWHLMRGLPYLARMVTGLRRPSQPVMGREVSGIVEAVGNEVTRFKIGDEVFGWCGAALAEYTAVAETSLTLKPAKMSHEEAAVLPISGFTALQGLRDMGKLQPGQDVLILGASGGVGTFAVQIAKALGGRVTGVCSTKNLDLVRSLGADHVIDYTREDFSNSGRQFDLIVDLVGTSSLARCRRALKRGGTLVMIGSSGVDVAGLSDRVFKGMGLWLRGMLLSPFVSQRFVSLIHKDSLADLETLATLVVEGKVRPVVTATYPLSQVPDALARFENGHATGKIAITVLQSE